MKLVAEALAKVDCPETLRLPERVRAVAEAVVKYV